MIWGNEETGWRKDLVPQIMDLQCLIRRVGSSGERPVDLVEVVVILNTDEHSHYGVAYSN